jgi:site-specific DNA-methyltransferase (adenine-specific)
LSNDFINKLFFMDHLAGMRQMLPDNSIDAIVTDPPYGFGNGKRPGFMGKEWDRTVPGIDVWREALRVLKPGGHLLSFFGTRTYHRGVVNIEDAGFEIRDQLGWLYSQGFPKSMDVSKAIDKAAGAERPVVGEKKLWGHNAGSGAGSFSKNKYEGQTGIQRTEPITAPTTPEAQQWDGWGTALKPAWEPIVLARKPISEETVAANVLKWGTGAINVDKCRVPAEPGEYDIRHYINEDCFQNKTPKKSNFQVKPQPTGRFPANILHDGSEEVLDMFPDSNGQQGDIRGTEPSLPMKNVYGNYSGRIPVEKRGDTGSAARFFIQCRFSEGDICDNANTVENILSRQERVENFVLKLVAIEQCQEDKQLRDMIIPFMNVIRISLKSNEESVITMIHSTGSRCLHGLARMIMEKLSHNPVKYAEIQKLINTMMIIQNLLNIDGFVGNIISNAMLHSMVRGEKVYVNRFKYCAKASKLERGYGNTHPTVKPLALMRYLCRLVTPPGGIVLDICAGSGTTLIAAWLEGFKMCGFEDDPDSYQIAVKRMAEAFKQERLFA